MAKVTAALVKQLREMTDSPMMECKKALVEAEGDIEKAVDVLRTMGLNTLVVATVGVSTTALVVLVTLLIGFTPISAGNKSRFSPVRISSSSLCPPYFRTDRPQGFFFLPIPL